MTGRRLTHPARQGHGFLLNGSTHYRIGGRSVNSGWRGTAMGGDRRTTKGE